MKWKYIAMLVKIINQKIYSIQRKYLFYDLEYFRVNYSTKMKFENDYDMHFLTHYGFLFHIFVQKECIFEL